MVDAIVRFFGYGGSAVRDAGQMHDILRFGQQQVPIDPLCRFGKRTT